MKIPLSPKDVEGAHREAEDACTPDQIPNASGSSKKDDEFFMDLPEFYLALVLLAERIFTEKDPYNVLEGKVAPDQVPMTVLWVGS